MTDSATPTDRTRQLSHAETALQCATNRREAMAAIREYFAAKADTNPDDGRREGAQ